MELIIGVVGVVAVLLLGYYFIILMDGDKQ